MIYDHRSNLPSYRGLSPLFDLALRYLEETDLTTLEAGKYPTDDNSVFVLTQAPCTRSRTENRRESRQRYIDTQYLISSREQVGFQNTGLLTVEESYDADRDIAFYRDNGQGFLVPMVPESFIVYFLQDARMPLVCADTPESIKKAVIKIKMPEGNSRERRD